MIALFFPRSLSVKKNYPSNESILVVLSSIKLNLLTPQRAKFLAISTPAASSPIINTLELAYFLTASNPKAPMYLDHLFVTAWLSRFISFFPSLYCSS